MKTYLAKIYYSITSCKNNEFGYLFVGFLLSIFFMILLGLYLSNQISYWPLIFVYFLIHQVVIFDSFFRLKLVPFLCKQFKEISEKSKKFNQENK